MISNWSIDPFWYTLICMWAAFVTGILAGIWIRWDNRIKS